MRIITIFAALAACGVIGVAGQAQPTRHVLAEVESREITLSELADYMEGRVYLYLYPDRAEAYRRALDDLITDKLKRIDFFESGLAREDSIIGSLQRIVTEEMVLAYAQERYEGRYLNEQTIRNEHESMGRVVFYRQIVLRKPPAASDPELESLRATVHEIRERIDAGVPFDSLIDRYSATASMGGHAPIRLTWAQTVRSPRDYILFHLSPGDVRSFEGPDRFTITRIERIERVEPPSLEVARERIVEALHARHAAHATRAFREEWNAAVDSLSLRWDPSGLQQVVDWSNTEGFFEGDGDAMVEQYLRDHEDAMVLADEHGVIRLSDIPDIINNVLTLEASGGHSRELIQDYLLEAVRTKRIADRARAVGVQNKVWDAYTPSQPLAQAFVRIYNEVNIKNKIPRPENDALLAFYEAHHDSLFYQLSRVSTEIIVRKDEEEITALLEKVKAGASFAEVSSRRLIRSFQRSRDGTIEVLNTREPPYLGEVALGLQEGEIAGPIAYDDAKEGRVYAIVRAMRRLEARQLSFDEARERVKEAFLAHHEARLAEEIASDLRKRYRVTVYGDVLAQLTDESR